LLRLPGECLDRRRAQHRQYVNEEVTPLKIELERHFLLSMAMDFSIMQHSNSNLSLLFHQHTRPFFIYSYRKK
jgi:hypothetical protein